jgi:hypothetical protein
VPRAATEGQTGRIADLGSRSHSRVGRPSRVGQERPSGCGTEGNESFFTYYMCAFGLGLGYAAPYPCHPLDPPMTETFGYDGIPRLRGRWQVVTALSVPYNPPRLGIV